MKTEVGAETKSERNERDIYVVLIFESFVWFLLHTLTTKEHTIPSYASSTFFDKPLYNGPWSVFIIDKMKIVWMHCGIL